MKLSDVKNFKDSILNVRFHDLTKDLLRNEEGMLSQKDKGKNFTLTFDGTYFHINCNGVFRTLQLKNDDRRDIFDLFKKGITVVSELIMVDSKKSCICMNIYPFYDCMELGDAYIGVSDDIKNKLKKYKLDYSFENVENENDNQNRKNNHILSELFSLEIDDQPYFLFKAPDERDFNYEDKYELEKQKKAKKERDNNVEASLTDSEVVSKGDDLGIPNFLNDAVVSSESVIADKMEEDNNVEASLTDSEVVSKEDDLGIPDFLKDAVVSSENVIADKMEEEHRAFTLIGNGLRTPVKIVKEDDYGSSKLHVKQLILRYEKNPERYGLVHGTVHFIDDSQSYKVSSQVAGIINELYKNNDSYLLKWDQYCQYEMKQYLRTCLSFGYAKIVDVEPNIDGYNIALERTVDTSDCLDGDEIIIVNTQPVFLNDLYCDIAKETIDDKVREIIDDFIINNKDDVESLGDSHYKLSKVEDTKTRILKIQCSEQDIKPKEGDFVYLSCAGNLSFGYAKIDHLEQNIDSYTINLDRLVNTSDCSDGDEIIIADSMPVFLNDLHRDIARKAIEDLSRGKVKEIIDDFIKNYNANTKTSNNSHYQLSKGRNARTQILKVQCSEQDIKPKKGDFVYLSITGNLRQHERRKLARELINSKQCGNPHLGVLLEDNESLDLLICNQKRVEKRVNPLSERIKQKIFSRNPPTLTQIKAIDIALNTPDIALIQGPPGTGKTTVITAIIERLNELSEKKGSIKGNVLVSGFQHDAVENIVDRLSINSLPVEKFGIKRGASENDSATMHRIENWANDIAEKIRKNNPTIQATEEEKEWEFLYNEYLVSPSENNEIKILNAITNSRNSMVRQSTLVKEAKELLKKYSSLESDDLYEIRHAINSIRTKKNSYADDGADNCARLLVLSEDFPYLFDFTDLDILKKSANVAEEDIPAYLIELEHLKQRLQYRVLPKPEYVREKINHNIVDISQRMMDLLKDRSNNGKNEESQILVDFLSELENNPVGIRRSIEDYQFVYSATTQQSLSKSIIDAKGRGNGDIKCTVPFYDTVIIDEAARANPSDLLIPMVQAQKRIILVGDHRQLPHMIDESIVDAIKNNEKINSDIYKVSMFEYLFHRLQKLEKLDGIQRTVTLDAQYRTHPSLGRFASRLFYESHDMSEAYASPLPEEFFNQKLDAISDKCCCWFNVPNENNPMEKNSARSSYRTSEAEICARCIKHWIDTPEAEKLSFGIITFYSAQVLEIMKHLEKYEIAECDSKGEYKIRNKYQYLSNGKERLRVGSVDAFQGMEFDIVLLSLVRTIAPKDIQNAETLIRDTETSTEDKERAVNRIVGFLRMENRLCVSMSRQKRFLGIVGDAGFINTDICKKYVPSLAEFYKLCKSEGRIFKC